MAIKFDLFENPVKEGVSVPKLHAKVITKDVVTTREIREAIRKKCTASPADVAAVITALNDELYENLSNGYAVHLEGIGYFSLSLKCAPDINPKYIKDDDVQVRSIKFTPDKEDVRAVALPALRHRVVKNYKAEAEGLGIDEILRNLF